MVDCRRQSWEQLSSISDELGKWQPLSEGLPCWGRCSLLRVVIELVRLRTPCGEPAKPFGFYAALCLFSTGVPLKKSVNSRIFSHRGHSILTGQIEKFGQAGLRLLPIADYQADCSVMINHDNPVNLASLAI